MTWARTGVGASVREREGAGSLVGLWWSSQTLQPCRMAGDGFMMGLVQRATRVTGEQREREWEREWE